MYHFKLAAVFVGIFVMNISLSQFQMTRSFMRLQLMVLGTRRAENFFLKTDPGDEQNNNRFFSFA